MGLGVRQIKQVQSGNCRVQRSSLRQWRSVGERFNHRQKWSRSKYHQTLFNKVWWYLDPHAVLRNRGKGGAGSPERETSRTIRVTISSQAASWRKYSGRCRGAYLPWQWLNKKLKPCGLNHNVICLKLAAGSWVASTYTALLRHETHDSNSFASAVVRCSAF